MKKNFFLHRMLMAAMVCGLSMTTVACSDDDDENENGTEQRADTDPLDTDEARVAWRWINELTDETEFADNWKSKTYDVTLGQPSSQNELVRIVVVSSLDEAKQSFSQLANLSADELATAKTVNGGAAGTMAWAPSAEGAKNLAEVTVNSRLFPNLQKIVYCTRDQIGDNGLFGDAMKGTAFYRYGDVIQDGDGYYWVCARPSFAPDKGESHWINIFNAAASGGNKAIPAEYIKDKWNNLAKYNNQTILLPTKLPYDRESMWNLANLVWAMLDINGYKNTCLTYSTGSLGGFGYDFHGENFLRAVSAYWDEKIDGYTIWEKLFNATHEQMQSLQGMSFFYQGYSWTIGNSGYVWRYAQNNYRSRYMDSESVDEEKWNFVEEGMDINYFASAPGAAAKPFKLSSKDGNWSGVWVVRHKTGKQLMTSGKYSPYAQITSKDGKMHDIYRFNAKQDVAAGENVPQQTESDVKAVAPTAVKTGMIMGSDGRFYNTLADVTEAEKQPVALVVVAKSATPVEAGTTYNCLAIGLQNTLEVSSFAWGESGKTCGGAAVTTDQWQTAASQLNGLAMTKQLVLGCNDAHFHQAARQCATIGSKLLPENVRSSMGYSEWFLPSTGQWIMALQALGGTFSTATGFAADATLQTKVNNVFTKAGITAYYNTLANGQIWSSTPFDSDRANILTLSSTWQLRGHSKSSSVDVLPVIAFQVK